MYKSSMMMLLVAGLLFNASIGCQDKDNGYQLSKKHAVGFVINGAIGTVHLGVNVLLLMIDPSLLSAENKQNRNTALNQAALSIPFFLFNAYLCLDSMWVKTDREQSQQEKGHA